MHFQSRRIEDARVVAAPKVFGGILRRRVGSARTRAESQFLHVPHSARVGRENGPAEIREAANEKRRGFLDDVVRGLEPRDERLRRNAHDRAKAHVRVHLVDVAIDGLLPRTRLRHVFVHVNAKQPRLGAQEAEQSIEQRESSGIAVQ